ncbi:hypothetical protein [Haloarchaeobius litoreus]|uniref:DUF7995 domain-containing protein n=1 Tax=Haloarchaeobius litoreus TaxID=755306 RepID=A0ABD6DIZ9_9EURY|nr:hypothetical protein [Haloarchaeobius litoreus]
MHQLIYALVEAPTEDSALAEARMTFDRLVGATPHDAAVFDYYVTFDMDGHSTAGRDRWGDLPVAARVDSMEGQALLERGWNATVAEFERNLEKIRESICEYSTADVMRDRNLIRHACYNLGAYHGPSLYLYDRHGDGIRDPDHLERVLDTRELWIVPADVHY